jgi:hypothetical protein
MLDERTPEGRPAWKRRDGSGSSGAEQRYLPDPIGFADWTTRTASPDEHIRRRICRRRDHASGVSSSWTEP